MWLNLQKIKIVLFTTPYQIIHYEILAYIVFHHVVISG